MNRSLVGSGVLTAGFVASGIVELVCILVLDEAVNIERAAPPRGIAANASWQIKWCPAGRVELHLAGVSTLPPYHSRVHHD
jgi:hypothetical protein